jgi:hypothetical protein
MVNKHLLEITYFQGWWLMPVIPVLGKLRQADSKFEASLGYKVRPCLKIKQKKTY